MEVSVLVVTATLPFGWLIQETLESTGEYRVKLADSANEALNQCRETQFGVCIYDADILNPPAALVVARLRQEVPGLRVVLVPPENDPDCPETKEIAAEAYLSKPFYLPDLSQVIARVTGQSEAALNEVEVLAGAGLAVRSQDEGRPSPVPPPAEKAEPHKSLVNEGNRTLDLPPAWLGDVARAAQHLTRLLLESAAQAALIVQQGEVWAYAGELPQPAGVELAQIVGHLWDRGGGSDLARFVRLDSAPGEFMLYATRLGGTMVLTLVFDIATPFSKIRSQANQLAKALANPPLESETSEEGRTPGPGGEWESLEGGPEPALPALSPLFDDVPPPSPPKATPAPPDAQPEKAAPLEAGLASGAASTSGSMLPLNVAQPPPVAAPMEMAGFELGSDEFVPVSATVYSLHYSCLFVPRLPQHHLTGELAVRLADWMAQLCLAFNWRLEHFAIRPEYMQWVVGVSPATSPSYLMRLIRQHTSQHIFEDFAYLARENPSGDFWVPGYLIMSGPAPLPTEVIQNFVRDTRYRQGAARPIPRQR